jgi:hypothetical protein
MFPVERTIFFKLQFFLGVAPVFLGSIVAPLALAALQGYQFYRGLLACHIILSMLKGKNPKLFNHGV